jgi:hypothetical protein
MVLCRHRDRRGVRGGIFRDVAASTAVIERDCQISWWTAAQEKIWWLDGILGFAKDSHRLFLGGVEPGLCTW